MPKAQATTQATHGSLENASIMLLSEAVKQFNTKALADAIIVVIPDTGKAQFNGSHEIKTGKSAGKMSKATFVIAELGSSFAGLPVKDPTGHDLFQTEGDVAMLPLSLKLSIVAQPPNRDGLTVDEALNRKPKLVEVTQPAITKVA